MDKIITYITDISKQIPSYIKGDITVLEYMLFYHYTHDK